MSFATENREEQTADRCKEHLRAAYPRQLFLVEDFIREIEGKDQDLTQWGQFADISQDAVLMLKRVDERFEAYAGRGSLSRGRSLHMETKRPPATSPIWRWLFLCSLTSNATLTVISVVETYRGYPYLDHSNFPIRAGIVVWTLIVTTSFLIFVSPFFFRRRWVLAVLAWLCGLLAGAWLCVPTF